MQVADIGTLSHIERVMNRSGAREMCFTGNDYSAAQMKDWGFLSRVFDTPEEVLAESRKLAQVMSVQLRLVPCGSCASNAVYVIRSPWRPTLR